MAYIPCKKITDILVETCEKFGWDDYSYTFTLNSDWIDPNCVYVREASTNLSRFLTKYKRNGLHHNRFREAGLKSDLPQRMSLDPQDFLGAPGEKDLSRLLGEFGWKSGMSFPSYGYGGAFSTTMLYSKQPELNSAKEKGTILYLLPLLPHMNTWARELLERSPLVEPLSLREVECMGLVAEGKTSREIAEALSISKRTADFHIENATHKLGVSSRSQAVSRLSQLSAMKTSMSLPKSERTARHKPVVPLLNPCPLVKND